MSQIAAPRPARMLAHRYSVDELLGQGGMAIVYRGTDTKLGRTVAIKIMRSDFADNEQFRARFRQEAQSASRLAHPSVVRVFDAGDDVIQTSTGAQRLPFIVMEYIDGNNLHELIAQGGLTVTEACRIVSAVLTALEYSHRAGIIHRDIKPANIMITHTGQVKVMDFGIARAVSDTSSTVQQTTAILGTAAYFSPEQAKGETVDTRTDLYSVGVLLYELLAGTPPFTGETAVAVAYRHVSERPKPPSVHQHTLSPALDRVVVHALAKDRNRRFQNATEFQEALQLAERDVMPKLGAEEEQSSVLFDTSEEVSEADLALRRLSEAGGTSRSQTRPPVMWVWVGIFAVTAIVAAVMLWVSSMVPTSLIPATSRVIPELSGVPSEEAVQQLLGLGLSPQIEEIYVDGTPTGTVARTDPEAGSRVALDTEVVVFVSLGPEHPEVPEFQRLSLDEYTAQVEAAGLTIGSVYTQDSPTEPASRMIGVSPDPGTSLARGERIDVTVSSGNVVIPDVTGQALDVAISMLEGLASVAPEPRNDCPSSAGFPVFEQSLLGQQPQGAAVTLIYCSGQVDPEDSGS